jgi:GTP 3',8-cyclase
MNADKFRIDSHKLVYHVPRVYQWLKGKNIYPVYMDIALYGGCNHRCVFCAFDYLKYKPHALDKKYLKKFIIAAAKKGVKSVMYSGEGEPLLHKDFAEIVRFTKGSGIDVAVTSNAVMFTKDMAKKTLACLSWFRASVDAGRPKTYSRIHRAEAGDFYTVLKNLKEAVRIRDKEKYACTIGAQLLLIPDNYSEAAVLAKEIRGIGLDYLIIKPYSRHPASNSRPDHKLRGKDLFSLEKRLEKYHKGGFQVIFRRQAMQKIGEKNKPYKHCLGSPFAIHITPEGDIYPCNVFLGKREFVLGNIYKESFPGIWESKRRGKIMDFIYNQWDAAKCRKACRIDEINRYLWELKNPGSHVNFI